jgi:PKD repeat protein
MDVIDLHGGIYYTCTTTVNLPCICTEEENPTPVFTATEIKSNNTTTIINDTSTPSDIIQWTYDFGDGTTPINFNTTTKPDPFIFTHTYSSCGSYVIKLIVHDAMGCWAETTRTISCGGGNCEPDDIRAEFSATAAPNNPKLFNFIDSSYSNNNTLTRWEWDFGDGTSAINTSPPGTFPIEYDQCGSFPVKLRVWDDIGCWDDVIKEVSCNCPKPIAQFTVESMSNPREFRFTSTSTHDPSVTITDWEWDFGDGVTSTGSSVTHRYTSPGTYTVRLRVTTNCGSWDHTFQDITTGCPSPKAAFEYTNTTNPQQFVFTDRSTHEPFVNISWLWEFGDGTNSTEQNPTHTFPSCSQYTVRLKVTADCGSSNETIQNVICGCPSPKAAFEYTTSANPQEFVFIDRSTHVPHVNLSWLWEFGDGTTSTEQNPTHTYPSCSQYTVRLKVTADCGSSNDTIQDIVCGCPPPVPDFDYKCIGERTVNFTDLSRGMGNGIRSWYWEFGDLRQDNISGLQNPTHEYDRPGTYPVNLSITTYCGSSARWTRQVTVPCCEMPVPDFTYTCLEDGNSIQFNDTSKLFGDVITRWSWDFGDRIGISSEKNPLYRYSQPGTYPVNLTITTACGAQNSWIHNVTVPCLCSPPIANFTKEMVSSKPFTMRFSDHSVPNSNSITSWNWSFGDGTTYSGQNPPEKTYNSCGEYLVNLRVTNDCGHLMTWISSYAAGICKLYLPAGSP